MYYKYSNISYFKTISQEAIPMEAKEIIDLLNEAYAKVDYIVNLKPIPVLFEIPSDTQIDYQIPSGTGNCWLSYKNV